MFKKNKDEIKTHDQNIKTVLLVLFIAIILILGITIVIVEVFIPSQTSSDGWLSFIGSFVGGCVGGIGTILAVYYTTRQTREIQQRNDRKNIANNIESKVSMFIADMTEYCYGRQRDMRLATECKVLLKMELVQFQCNIAWKDMATKIIVLMDQIYRESGSYRDNIGRIDIRNNYEKKCEELKKQTTIFTNTYKHDGREHY